MGRSTINDVAAQAGVSVATVSRALRGLPNVSQATRDRVLAAAQDLQYTVDSRASSLASGRTNVIALVAPDFGAWYIGQAVVGVETALAEAGYDLLVLVVTRGPHRHQELAARLKNRRVDGLLLIDFFVDPEGESVITQSIDMPAVVMGERIKGFTSLTIDNDAGGRLAAEHLMDLGHTRIAYVGGSSPEIRPVAADAPRKGGAVDALAARGLELIADVVSGYSIEDGRAAFETLWADPDRRPTAVFCGSDEIAIGLMTQARNVGVDIPADLSVVGFDDHELAAPLELTTVRQAVRENGTTAVELLLDLITQDTSAGGPPAQDHVAGLELVIRASTGSTRVE